jgi:hypothetical protein
LLTLQNTILYKNQPGGDCGGTITDGGHNLVFSASQLSGVVIDPCNVSSEIPVARDTAAIPPRPHARASLAAQNRR